MKWDKLEGIINKVAIKNRVDAKLVKSVIEHIMISIKNTLKDPRAPKILLHEYGTFVPKLGVVKKKLERLESVKNKLHPKVYGAEKERYLNLIKRLEDEEN